MSFTLQHHNPSRVKAWLDRYWEDFSDQDHQEHWNDPDFYEADEDQAMHDAQDALFDAEEHE